MCYVGTNAFFKTSADFIDRTLFPFSYFNLLVLQGNGRVSMLGKCNITGKACLVSLFVLFVEQGTSY